MKRILFGLIVGVIGTGILVSLGTWQIQRLDWKEGILAEIEARIDQPAVALPETPNNPRDKYLAVEFSGRLYGEPLRVLASKKFVGAGYRVIAPVAVGDRALMVDLGFVRLDDAFTLNNDLVTIRGNIHWPDEVDGYTPEPDLNTNIWFARDADAMSNVLETEGFLIVASQVSPDIENISPMRIDTGDIPNDHFNYAMTWFSLALIWALMTTLFIWRNRNAKKA